MNVQPHKFESEENSTDDYQNLPIEDPPYLPPLNANGKRFKYTLVLDLDETLIHLFEEENQGQVLIRPYVEEFLNALQEKYELVIFTAALKEYADNVVDLIDQKKYIQHRLYRQHTNKIENIFVKDLANLGRDLSKVIIVDNFAGSFKFQPENGICIKSWYGDSDDKELYELKDFFIDLYQKNVSNVRIEIKKYNEKIDNQISIEMNNIINEL